MKKLTAADYKKDPMFQGIAKAMDEILKECGQVSAVEVMMRTDRLKKENYEDWRFGRVPFLEKVFHGNLSRANRLLRIMRLHAKALGLEARPTEYRKWGKGRKIPLRFSKSGDPNVEAAYACHFVSRPVSKSE